MMKAVMMSHLFLEGHMPGRCPGIVSAATEKKLKIALDFIHDNYSSDISREGLAALVDLHPDSLSRFFKQYTDNKIREYINRLRIVEAARLLRETDAAVMEIAARVGFESLTTFNRAFLKEMHSTPTKYRRQAETRLKDAGRG